MSHINKKPFEIKLKEKITEKKSQSISKNNKISSKKINNIKRKTHNNPKKVSLEISQRLNYHKRIIVERKLNTSISSRNKNNVITIARTFHLPNQNINKKDFSSLIQKKIVNKNYEQIARKILDLNIHENKEKSEHNFYSNIYVNNFNNNFFNIKNIKIENKKEQLYDLEDDDSNTIITSKKGIGEIDNETIQSYSITNNNNEKIIHNSVCSNINNLFSKNNTININGLIREEKISNSKKENSVEKSLDFVSLDHGTSLSSLGSLFNNIPKTLKNTNSSSSTKDIIKNFHYKNNIYNFNHNNLNSCINLNKRKTSKSKSKNKINPINIYNKKRSSHSKNKFKCEPNSFFGGSRSVYNLSNISGEFRKNKINSVLNDNFEKKNNSMSFRNRNKTKSKEINSPPLLDKRHDSSEIKKKKRIKIKINKQKDKNNKNLNEKKTKSKLIISLVSKKNSSSIFSASATKRKHKNKITEKAIDWHNESKLNLKRKEIPLLIKNKKENNIKNTILNSKKDKNEKKNDNIINKRINKNDFESYKSDNRCKNKYKINKIKENTITKKDEQSSEILTSPLTVASSRHSHKIIQKEYPNMALASKNPQEQHASNQQNVQKDKNVSKTIKKIDSLCKVGHSGQNIKKLNQDNFFIFREFLNNPLYLFVGVCDGHGIYGQNISFYLKENLPKNLMDGFLQKKVQNLEDVNIFLFSKIVDYIYQKTNKEMNEDERIDSSFSGSTSVSYIFTPERFFCINVGDSRCIIGKFDKNTNEWTPMNLSRDHKPSDPDEKSRIIQNGGRVESYMDEERNYVGPERVWLQNEDTPGLAMSRSFGDEVAHKVGVIVSPEIYDYHFEEEDKFIIVASDGIWEFMSSDEVVEIVKDFYLKNDLEGALDYLYNESSKRWINKENIIDDITVVIAFLD